MGKLEVIVECEYCGKEFKPGIVVENSQRIALTGNKAQCPECGHLTAIDDRFIHRV